MAEGLKPNLRSLLKDLKEVTDWFRLGIWLGVEYTVLTTIENNHKQDGERCMIEMLEFWLKNLDASWSEVISALEAIDHRNLAKRLREEHKILQTDDVDVTKSQNLDPTGDQSKELFHARCKINHLDIVVRREYAKFTTDLLSLLERKGVSVNDAIFQFVQLDMGVLTNDMRGATDNRAFLIALKHTQSWYDFNITASLAESLGGDEGAELVRAYETKLKSNLQKRRKVFKLVNTKKLVIKFNEKREHFTKEKREDFEAIIVRLMNVKDKKKELVLKSIRDGCVEVTYLFPSTLAPAIKSTIVSELNDHKVISMSIDGEVVWPQSYLSGAMKEKTMSGEPKRLKVLSNVHEIGRNTKFDAPKSRNMRSAGPSHTRKKPSCHELIKEICQNTMQMKRTRCFIAAIVLLLLVHFVAKFIFTQV